MNIGFRVDGSESIGMGHIMRSISLAKAFKQKNHNVVFITREKLGKEKIKLEKFDILELKNLKEKTKISGYDYGNEAERKLEVEELKKINKDNKIDLLIVDSYNVDENYFIELKKEVRYIAYIDDINRKKYKMDILINGNIDGEHKNYDICPSNLYLLGPSYNLIRDEFRDLSQHKISSKIKNIMITTGGSDYYELTNYLSDKLLEISQKYNYKININIVVGGGFQNTKSLVSMKNSVNTNKCETQINLFTSNKDNQNDDIKYKAMIDIMKESDIAISSGGSTLYELCAVGIPSISFILADNQKKIVEMMEKLGYIESLGWYNKININKLTDLLEKWMENFELRKKISLKNQSLVDAYGTLRIVDEIEKWIELKED